MIWLDIIVFAIILGAIYVESNRGFGLALFDLIGGLLLVIFGARAAESVAASVQLLADKGENQALWLVIMFLAGAVATVFIGRFLHGATQVSLDVLDPALGAAIGIVVGLLVSYVLLAALTLTAGDSEFGTVLKDNFVMQEFYYFRGWRLLIDALERLGQ